MTAIGGFVLDEDEALKQKLSGYEVAVYAQGGALIPIKVYFRFPDTEEVTRTFPHLAIDLVDVRYESSRTHRANSFINRQTWTNPATPAFTTEVADDMPLPWSLIYQIAAYARNPREDRQLQVMMLQLFPEQYGFLDMSQIDGTFRRADLISAERRDTVDNTRKRLYRNIFTVAISSEFSLSKIQEIAQVRMIDIQLNISTGSILVNQG